MIDLNGKTALIIGGMNALAGGVAQRLSDAGASIIFGSLVEHHSEALALASQLAASGRSVNTRPVTLNNPDALKAEIALFGTVNIAVVIPSWFEIAPFLDTLSAEWEAALLHNFEHATYAAQAAAHHLITLGRGGRIIFLSLAASLMPHMNSSVVGTSLAALRALAKMAAVDLAPYGITVNTVAAGWVETEWTAKYLSPEGRTYVEQDIPIGRISTFEDIGNACCFLCSDPADYITGVTIPVDGGYLLTKAEVGKMPYPQIT